jgi:methyl-accepting chemotaxis protein
MEPSKGRERRSGTRRRRLFSGSAAARRYAAWIATFMFCYAVIVFGLVVAAAFVAPASKLASSLPLQVREEAALQFLALGDVFWPVLLSLIVGAAIFSISLARRIAGPMDRLQTFCNGLAEGDLASRIRLRSSDELHPLHVLINRSLDRLEGELLEVREQQIGE